MCELGRIKREEALYLCVYVIKKDRVCYIYRKRYITNSKLYEKSVVKDFIRKKLSKKKINFNSTRIKKFGVEQRVSKNNEYTIDDSDREEK